MKHRTGNHSFPLRLHVVLILLAALAISMLSAGIRHVEAGLTCPDRGSCYGRIEAGATVATPALLPAGTPTTLTWAKRTHRLLAGTLVLLVLVLVYRLHSDESAPRAQTLVSFAMLALLFALAMIGPMSQLKIRPIVATSNIVGGIALVALTWQLLLMTTRSRTIGCSARLRHTVQLGLLLLVLQIVAGAWTSANFAGLACQGIPGCVAEVYIGATTPGAAFNPFRELVPTPAGRVLVDAAAFAINQAHRLGALLAALVLASACLGAIRLRITPRLWLPVAALLAIQLALGVGSITTTLSLSVVLCHGLVSILLLMATMRFANALRPMTTGVGR